MRKIKKSTENYENKIMQDKIANSFEAAFSDIRKVEVGGKTYYNLADLSLALNYSKLGYNSFLNTFKLKDRTKMLKTERCKRPIWFIDEIGFYTLIVKTHKLQNDKEQLDNYLAIVNYLVEMIKAETTKTTAIKDVTALPNSASQETKESKKRTKKTKKTDRAEQKLNFAYLENKTLNEANIPSGCFSVCVETYRLVNGYFLDNNYDLPVIGLHRKAICPDVALGKLFKSHLKTNKIAAFERKYLHQFPANYGRKEAECTYYDNSLLPLFESVVADWLKTEAKNYFANRDNKALNYL